LSLALTVFLAASGWSHEGSQHILGTVTGLDGGQMVVQTKDGKSVTIHVGDKTRYARAGAGEGAIKVGDRVVAEVAKTGADLTASEVRFSSVPPKK
jgi:translation initiation factor IF-1